MNFPSHAIADKADGMDTRTLLLDHAEAVVRSRGFDGFSYADLADAVGIRKASVHYHFPRKADLALALIERYSARLTQRVDALGAQGSSAAERLRGLVATYRAAIEGGTKLCLCVALAVGRDSLGEPVIARLAAFHDQLAGWLTGCFELARSDGSVAAVGDPAAEALATLALMEGAQLIARVAGRVDLFDAATAPFLARLQ